MIRPCTRTFLDLLFLSRPVSLIDAMPRFSDPMAAWFSSRTSVKYYTFMSSLPIELVPIDFRHRGHLFFSLL